MTPKITCHYYKKPGDVKKDCRHRENKSKEQDSSKNENSNAFMVSALQGEVEMDQWIVDSGARNGKRLIQWVWSKLL